MTDANGYPLRVGDIVEGCNTGDLYTVSIRTMKDGSKRTGVARNPIKGREEYRGSASIAAEGHLIFPLRDERKPFRDTLRSEGSEVLLRMKQSSPKAVLG
jgi:hypothetical protein